MTNEPTMIKNFFKIAWRNLWRHKRMTIINVAGIGIGMAATVLIAIWVQNETSFDQAQPDADNIYRITAHIKISPTETWVWESSQYVLGEQAQKQVPEIENLTRLSPVNYESLNLHYDGRIIPEKKAAYVDAQWFNMFHYDFIEGSPEYFVKNPFSLILTASAAKKYFGNQEAVGKIMRIDTVNYQVSAVVKDNPANSSFQYNVLMPIDARLSDPNTKKNDMNWGNYEYMTFLKLKQGANKNVVATKLLQILAQTWKKGEKGDASYSLINLRDIHFENDLQSSAAIHGNRTMVNVFIALAALLLITACINYVNLTTARASIRSKEVGIRKIFGADRLQLFGQFMSESFVVSFLALLLSVILVQVSMPWFREFTSKEFAQPLTSTITWTIIGLTLLVSFLLNGLYPAILLSSFQPLKVFRGSAVLNFKDSGLRRMLVVLQFTISVILIIGTLVIYTQLRYMEKIDLGYTRSQVFTFNVPWRVLGFKRDKREGTLNAIKQALLQQSAIKDVSMANSELVDLTNSSSGSFDWPGRPKDFNPTFNPLQVDSHFQEMMHLKIASGRWFNGSDADKHNVLLNETALKAINLIGPPVGQRFIHQGDTGVIIGVLKDFHYRSLHDKIGAMIISNQPSGYFYVKTGSNTPAAIAAAEKVWQKFVPEQPFVYSFLDDSYDNLYKTEQQSSVLVSLFAGIAILVSALGLLGLAAFAAEQKVKEIGIRKVLGASVQHIVSLLSADFLKMVLIASIIAFPIAWWAMNKWLQDFAYRISLSWWIFALSAAIAMLIALVTVSLQSVKAATANPVKSLRSE